MISTATHTARLLISVPGGIVATVAVNVGH
jgi:hypothetical protein